MSLPALHLPSNHPRRAGASFSLAKRPLCRARSLLLFAIIASFAWLSPARADAFERQWHTGASLGYLALLRPDVRTRHGLGGSAHVAYGLTDTVNLIGELNLTGYPSGSLVLTGGGVGASYIFDVIQWVPYIGALVGAYDVIDASGECDKYCHSLRLNLEIPFGIDYTVSRDIAVGVAGRYQVLISGYSPAQGIGAFARFELLWGY
jgi:hypothetical protein